MQFHRNGPELPERLLRAHEEGRVVFFCGAGISMPRGLPGFKELALQLFERAGEVPNALEQSAIKAHQYDRAIGLLEGRHISGRPAIRQNLADLLQPDPLRRRQLDTHASLLTLARGRSGEVRLVTTNFDRLFDEAGVSLGIAAPAHYAPFLPVPKNRWQGIVYLHGGVAAPHSAGVHDEIVLSSGDFGLAYLSERWAARFVSDLFRTFTVCFVGYSLTDPVLRYMVDAIAADSLRGESSPEVFAFSQYSRGQKEPVAAAWKARRVTPILYRAYHSHKNLHQTLSEWAALYRDGIAGKERIVTQYAQAMPFVSTHEDNVVGRMIWALSDPHGGPAKRFAEHTPPAALEWLGPLTERMLGHDDLPQYGVTPDPKKDENLRFALVERPAPYRLSSWMSVSSTSAGPAWDRVMLQLARWLCRHLNEPKLLVWMAQRLPIHAAMIRELQWALPVQSASPRMRTLWGLLLSGMFRPPNRWPSFYEWSERFREDGWTLAVKRQFLALLEPRLTVTESLYWRISGRSDGDEPADPAGKLDVSIVLAGEDVEYVYSQIQRDEQWRGIAPYLLDDLTLCLSRVLDLFAEIGEAGAESDRSFLVRPTIEEHVQNQSFKDWPILISMLRDSWEARTLTDPQSAKGSAVEWMHRPYPLFMRLALFAARNTSLFSPAESLRMLLTAGGRWLWSIETRREALRLLVDLAPRVSTELKEALESALLAGFPADLLREDLNPVERQRAVDRELWVRLAKVQQAGMVLSTPAQARLSALSGQYPEWELAADERDEFLVWSGAHDPIRETSMPPRERAALIAWLRVETTSRYDDGQWFELAKTDYPRATVALLGLAAEGVWPSRWWGAALNAWAADEKVALRTWRRVATVLNSAPDGTIRSLGTSVGWYLEAVGKVVIEQSERFLALVDRVTELCAGELGPDDGEPVNRAINHPTGRVTEALVFYWQRQNLFDGVGLSPLVRERFSKLCQDSRPAMVHGRVVLASRLVTLYRVDADWTVQNLIERLSWTRDETEALAMWCGVLWSGQLFGPLLQAFKTEFLDTASRYEALGGMRSHYVGLLVLAALDYPRHFERGELAGAFRALPSSALEEGARYLVRLQESAAGQAEESWSNRIRPFLEGVWPKSNELHTGVVANAFGRLALAAGGEFSDAVGVLSIWISGAERPGTVLHILRGTQYVTTHPETVLELLDLLFAEDTDFHAARLAEVLEELRSTMPELVNDPRMRRLSDLSSQGT